MNTEFLLSLLPVAVLALIALAVVTSIRTAIAFRELTFRKVFTACVALAVVLWLINAGKFPSPIQPKVDLTLPNEWGPPEGLVAPTIDEQMNGARSEPPPVPPLPFKTFRPADSYPTNKE